MLEIEVQGAQQVRAAEPDSVQIFIAPPDPATCAAGSRAGGPTRPRRSTPASRPAELEFAVQGDFDHRVVNDDLARAAAELEQIVRAELGIPLDSTADDQTTR